MKKFILAKLATLAILAGLYSCNSGNASFDMTRAYYVTEYQGKYTPVAWFFFFNGELNQASITRDGMPLTGYSPADNYYELDGRYDVGYSPSAMNGTYTLSANSTEGEYISFSFRWSFDKVLGDFDFTDFEYNYHDRTVTYTVTEQVENGSFYGIFYHIVSSNATYPNSSASWKGNLQQYYSPGSGEQTCTFDFSSIASALTNNMYVRVYPYVAESSSGGLLMKLGQPKILHYEGTSLEDEDGTAEIAE